MVRSGIDAQRVFVVGSGVVGASTGWGFRAAGHDVTFVDTSPARVRELRQSGIRGGAPYGGVCLPRDTNGFLGFAAELGVETPLLQAVVDTNERLEHLVAAAEIGGTITSLRAHVPGRQAAVADVA